MFILDILVHSRYGAHLGSRPSTLADIPKMLIVATLSMLISIVPNDGYLRSHWHLRDTYRRHGTHHASMMYTVLVLGVALPL